MAKDDYYVIVGKILTFLYCRLKKKTDKGMEYLSPNTEDFPIAQEYFDYVLAKIYERGLIENLTVAKSWSGDIVRINISEKTQITPEGIDFLMDNSKIRKVLKLIPMAATIGELFQ